MAGIERPNQDGDGLGSGSTGDGSDYDIGTYEFLRTVPLPPENLRLISVSNNDITIVWDASPESNIAGYRLFLREEGQDYDYYSATWEGNTTICTISDLAPNVTIMGQSMMTVCQIRLVLLQSHGAWSAEQER